MADLDGWMGSDAGLRTVKEHYYIINQDLYATGAPTPTRQLHIHVLVRVFLHGASIYRVITSSLLFLSNAQIPEAENSLGHKKEVACISLWPVQARQRRSNRSTCRIVTFLSSPHSQAHSGHSHLNVSKRPGRKNRLSLTAYSAPSQTAKLRKLMPYS